MSRAYNVRMCTPHFVFRLKSNIRIHLYMKDGQPKRTISIRKFKEWVSANLSPDIPLYQVVQKEKDELPLDEAIVKSCVICALIDSLDSKSLKKTTTLEAS